MTLPLKKIEDIKYKHFFGAMNPSVFSQIRVLIESNNFPWYYTDKTADPNESSVDRNFQFTYPVYLHRTQERSRLYDEFNLDNVIRSILVGVGENVETILRVKLNLNVNVGEKIDFAPHVDTEFQHKVGIFYFNTCDGETILYREYDGEYTFNNKVESKFIYNNQEKYQFNVFKKFDPIENSMLLFDGCMYHAGSSPTNTNRRIIMNINYTVY